jgi:hypothetical protein
MPKNTRKDMQQDKVKIANAVISLMIFDRMKNKGGITIDKDYELSKMFQSYSSNMVDDFMYDSYTKDRKN